MNRTFMLWSARVSVPPEEVLDGTHRRQRPEGVRAIPARVLLHHLRHDESFGDLEIIEAEDAVRAFGQGWDITCDPATNGTIWIQADAEGHDAAMAAIRHFHRTWGLSVYDTRAKTFVPGPDETPVQAMTRDTFFAP